MNKKQDEKVVSNLAKAYVLKGNELSKVGDDKKAVEFYEEAKKVDVKEITAYEGIAKSYDKLGEKDKVVDNYKQLVALAPENNDIIGSFALQGIKGVSIAVISLSS